MIVIIIITTILFVRFFSLPAVHMHPYLYKVQSTISIDAGIAYYRIGGFGGMEKRRIGDEGMRDAAFISNLQSTNSNKPLAPFADG